MLLPKPLKKGLRSKCLSLNLAFYIGRPTFYISICIIEFFYTINIIYMDAWKYEIFCCIFVMLKHENDLTPRFTLLADCEDILVNTQNRLDISAHPCIIFYVISNEPSGTKCMKHPTTDCI